ncbi:MAG: ferritin family protein [Thermodesulfovibrionia bacterium]|nr:ferritin family protein [Thermodesulfovibrionia bacterium]
MKYSIQEIVEQAIQTEKLGYEFYTTLAEKFRDDGKLCGLFELLAGQELKHEQVFIGLKGQISTKSLVDWDEASHYLRAIVESEFFLGSKKALPSLQNIKTGNDALRHAMFFEKETLLYFYSMRDLVIEWKVVDEIINEEKSHIKQISQMMR